MIAGQYDIGYYAWEAYNLQNYADIVVGLLLIGGWLMPWNWWAWTASRIAILRSSLAACSSAWKLPACCRCAACRGKAHAAAGTQGDAGIRIVSLHPVGYGVQIVFSDAHERGIYPWAYLRTLGRSPRA